MSNSDIIQACSKEGIELGKNIKQINCKDILTILK